MKKVYLMICTIIFTSSLFAQSQLVQKNNIFDNNSSKFYCKSKPKPVSLTKASSAPFFTDDFSDPNLWTMTDLTNFGFQNWVITTNAPTGGFSNGMGAIASTTSANGFALFDSDALSTSYSNTQDAILAFNNSPRIKLFPSNLTGTIHFVLPKKPCPLFNLFSINTSQV